MYFSYVPARERHYGRLAIVIPEWLEKFYDSLREAIRENLLFQEAAFFRHESGRVLRPVVVSVAKNSIGTICKLRVIFTTAFGPPLTDDPSAVQRLADGIRLAVRTRLEVVDPYFGEMSRIHHQKVLSDRPEAALAKQNSVGCRLIAALDAIRQEAVCHGVSQRAQHRGCSRNRTNGISRATKSSPLCRFRAQVRR